MVWVVGSESLEHFGHQRSGFDKGSDPSAGRSQGQCVFELRHSFLAASLFLKDDGLQNCGFDGVAIESPRFTSFSDGVQQLRGAVSGSVANQAPPEPSPW